MTINDYRRKYYDEFCQVKIEEYRHNNPNAAEKTDANIREELGLYLRNGEVLKDFIMYCARREIALEEQRATRDVIEGYRIEHPEATKYSDEEILQMVPLSITEREYIAKGIYEKMARMLEDEIRELVEEYESDMEALKNPNLRGQERSELSHDVSSTQVNITMRETAKQAFTEQSRGLYK